LEEILVYHPAVHTIGGIRSAVEIRLIGYFGEDLIEVIFIYDMIADSKYEGDEFLFHLGIGSEIISNLTFDKEFTLESKMNPNFDIEIL
jgi:hypothetical protein